MNATAYEGYGEACTPREATRMSFMFKEALGIVLDEALIYALKGTSKSRQIQYKALVRSIQFANHRSELKFKQNIFQTTLAVFAQHNKRLRLKFITSSTTIVLQKSKKNNESFRVAHGGPLEDEERKCHGVMIRVAMNNRIYRFRQR